jgi:hypothetical protein
MARTTSSERITVETDSRRIAVLTTSLLLLIAGLVSLTLLLITVLGPDGVLVVLVSGPIILFQDRLRYVCLRARPLWAVASDTSWLLLVVAGLALAFLGTAPLLVLWFVWIAGPSLSLLLLSVGAKNLLDRSIGRDLRFAVHEIPFVVDSWLLAATVFVVFAIVGAFGSLGEVAQQQVLFLIFQPLFSIGYAGRLLTLGPEAFSESRRWPQFFAAIAVTYAVFSTAILLIGSASRPQNSLIQIGVVSLVLMSVGQIFRAYHQGVADIARRDVNRGLLPSRIAFAATSIVVALVLVPLAGLEGSCAALCAGFGAGALMASRIPSMTEANHAM